MNDAVHIVMRLPDWFPLLRFKRDAERLAPHVIAFPEIALNETRKAMVRSQLSFSERQIDFSIERGKGTDEHSSIYVSGWYAA